jgi:hypothetical protein
MILLAHIADQGYNSAYTLILRHYCSLFFRYIITDSILSFYQIAFFSSINKGVVCTILILTTDILSFRPKEIW